MLYELKKNLHFCYAEGRIVFLDLERDRYFSLPSRLEAAFKGWIGKEPSAPWDAEALAILCDKDVLTKTEKAEVPNFEATTNPVRPASSLIENGELRADFLTVAEAISERLHCRRLLKTRPLLAVLSSIAARPFQFHTVESPDPAILAAASAFEASNRWLAAHDQCLERSVALVRFLTKRRHHSQLILGVTMTPFKAHAWVQRGTLVLNDTLAKVSNYTPILVI